MWSLANCPSEHLLTGCSICPQSNFYKIFGCELLFGIFSFYIINADEKILAEQKEITHMNPFKQYLGPDNPLLDGAVLHTEDV